MKLLLSIAVVLWTSVASAEFVEFEAYKPAWYHPFSEYVFAIGYDDSVADSYPLQPLLDGSYVQVWRDGELVHRSDDTVHQLYKSVSIHGPTDTNPVGRATVMLNTITNRDRLDLGRFWFTWQQYQLDDPWTQASYSSMTDTPYPSNLDNGRWRLPTISFGDGGENLYFEQFNIHRVGPVVGDSNFDGLFDFDDVLTVLSAGKFETDQPALWSQGDWNRDGQFSFHDILAVLAAGQPAGTPQAALSAGTYAIPEPQTLLLATLGLVGLLTLYKRQLLAR